MNFKQTGVFFYVKNDPSDSKLDESHNAENTHKFLLAAVAMELSFFFFFAELPDESGFTFPKLEVKKYGTFKLGESLIKGSLQVWTLTSGAL